MDSLQLQAWQYARLREQVAPMSLYLNRLVARAEQKHFSRRDTLYVATSEAALAIERLLGVIQSLEREAQPRERPNG